MGVVTGGGGGGGAAVVQVSTVTLSSAQILALGTTPVTLVAAVAGKIIVPVSMCTVLTYGTTTYVETGSPRAFIGPTFGGSGWGSIVSGVAIPGTNNSAAISDVTGSLAGDREALTLLTGQPLRLDENNAVTTGDGTLAITTTYYLVTP